MIYLHRIHISHTDSNIIPTPNLNFLNIIQYQTYLLVLYQKVELWLVVLNSFGAQWCVMFQTFDE